MTAENIVDDPVSELAAGILCDVVGETLAMLTLIAVESATRGILSVAVGETLGMSIFVTVGPVGGNDTTKKSNELRMAASHESNIKK